MANLLLAFDGRVATLTIQRPDALNALDNATIDELLHTLSDLYAHPDLGALIITGSGDKAFVAGADIKELARLDEGAAWTFSRRGHAVCDMLASAPFVTLAAVNGYALGGGCELALACDLIYAAEHAHFGQPEVNLGVVPGFGGTQRLARLVGPMLARHLVLTGRMIDAQEALRIGLVAQLYPSAELLPKVQRTAATIAAKAPLAIAKAKHVMAHGLDLSLDDACRVESEAFAELFNTQDLREGMSAFIDKRTPHFTGS